MKYLYTLSLMFSFFSSFNAENIGKQGNRIWDNGMNIALPQTPGCLSSMRRFGTNDQYLCNCKELDCDFANRGKCKSEDCIFPYRGKFCQRIFYHNYLKSNISEEKNVFTKKSIHINNSLTINFEYKYRINLIKINCSSPASIPSETSLNVSAATISLSIGSNKFCEGKCHQITKCQGDATGRNLHIQTTSEISLSNVKVFGCSPFWFGEYCDKQCHCANNSECHKMTGKCSKGCESGRSGSKCQKFNYVNVALNKTASQSSTYGYSTILINNTCNATNFNFSADLAVDGNTDQQFQRLSCIHTTRELNPRWQVDLGKKFNISQIRIYNRIANGRRLNRVTINVDGKYCHRIYTATRIIDINCSSIITGRRIEITKTEGFLNFCEVEVLQCLPGFYGYRCSNSCPECKNSSCDQWSGECRLGCAPGYKKDLNKSCTACPVGTFGDRCNQTCHCKNIDDCDTVEGTCRTKGCAAGYTGEACQETCPVGTFGDRCNQTCHCKSIDDCDTVEGTCRTKGCAAGYTGEACQETCPVGTFGDRCNQTCHCKNIDDCDTVEGTCRTKGCAAGYKGEACQETCPVGTFGDRCNQTCHCKNIDDCDTVEGTCRTKGCAAGYKGEACQETCPVGTFGDRCNQTCHCKNIDDCDTVEGTCRTKGCAAGYKGEACQETCPVGTFGDRCNQTCHCKNIDDCDTVEGTCRTKGCAAGYKGEACQETCPVGTFGDRCNQTCHCKNIDDCDTVEGTCRTKGCAAGYKGEACQETCPVGTFGDRCSQICHCKNNNDCNMIEGTCRSEGCAAGYIGDKCQETCPVGTFGDRCNQTCHCKNIDDCDTVEGTCRTKGCAAGYKGEACQETCPVGTFGDRCSQICHCKNNNDCNMIEGTCRSEGCAAGYIGDKCQETSIPIPLIIGLSVLLLVKVAIGIAIYFRIRKSKKKQVKTSKVSLGEIIEMGPVVDNDEEIGPGPTDDQENIYMNCESLQQITLEITRENILAYVANKKLEELPFAEEFLKLPKGLLYAHNAAKEEKNKRKNRYKTILPYDHSRVWLNPAENLSSYINANYLTDNKTYIATQGPLARTIDDFWAMVYQTKCSIIVMLTNLSENGKLKCEQYWPDVETTETYGKISVSHKRENKYSYYTYREFCITKNSESILVEHYQFTSWPDHGAPKVSEYFIAFRNKIRSTASYKPPILVHCSAGVGRSGTYIVLDIILEEMENNSKIEVTECILKLRKDRTIMVQNRSQLEYIYDVLVENVVTGHTVMHVPELPQVYHQLQKFPANSSHSFMQLQFEQLILPLNPATSNCSNKEDTTMSYDNEQYMPDDEDDPTNDLITLTGNNLEEEFILFSTPSEEEFADFWSVIFLKRCTLLVMFDNMPNEEAVYWPHQKDLVVEYKHFVVKLVDEHHHNCYIKRTLKVSSTKLNMPEILVHQFQFKIWLGTDLPPPKEMAEIIRTIQSSQISQRQKQIALHCPDGISKNGLFSVLYMIIEILQRDSMISIVQLIRLHRRKKEYIISDYMSYHYCWLVAKVFLEELSLYTNE